MTGFLGLDGRRSAGFGLAGLLLLAGCTKVVTGKGTADHVAVTAYLASSSSSVASSKAAAVQQTVCASTYSWVLAVRTEWNFFVSAWNNDEDLSAKAGSLKKSMDDASSGIKALNADPSTQVGKLVADYAGALAGLSGQFTGSGRIYANSINSAYDHVFETGKALMDFCHS